MSCADARHDRRMLELLIAIRRALALSLRGRRELVLENGAAAAADGDETHDQAPA
jgi:hypothetical protein